MSKTITSFVVFLAAVLLSMSSAAYAQETSQTQNTKTPQVENTEAVLIANVNFMTVLQTPGSKEGSNKISFTISSVLGGQSGVMYGVNFQGRKTGKLLGSILTDDPLELPEGVSVTRGFEYAKPAYLSEDAEVFLVAYGSGGIPLATRSIAQVAKGEVVMSCEDENDLVSCEAPIAGDLVVRLTKENAYGKVVSEQTVPLSAGEVYRATLPLLTEKVSPGMYAVTFSLKVEGEIVGTYIKEYAKPGEFGRIMSVAPKAQLVGEEVQVDVVVYALSSVESSGLALMAKTEKCGESPVVPFVGRVETLSFRSGCDHGVVEVSLTRDGTVLDSMSVNFALPNGQTLSRGYLEGGVQTKALLVLLALLLVGVIAVVFVSKKKGTPAAPMVVLLFILASFVVSERAFAATYAIGGQTRYDICLTGGWAPNCAEPDFTNAYRTSGTVTVPDSVAPGATYNITVTHALTGTLNTLCSDSLNVLAPCTATQITTHGYYNIPPPVLGFGASCIGSALFVNYYNTLPAGCFQSESNVAGSMILTLGAGTPSQTFSRTAPVAGTSDNLRFLQNATGQGAPVTSCSGGLRCLTKPYYFNAINVAIAAPTCAWNSTAYINGTLPPGAAALHNAVRCMTPAPGDGTPNPTYCDVPAEAGTQVVCCDTGADCFRYTCGCSAPPPNTPPTVSAGANQAKVLPVSSATTAATASDSDGSIVSYSWTFRSGPTTPTIASPAALNTNITGMTAVGPYTFRLTVTDNLGGITFDEVNITVNPAPTFAITVTQGTGGTISPGTTSVTSGGSQTFTITPSGGYIIADVVVDGASVGAVGSYTFNNVTVAHTITASFTALSSPSLSSPTHTLVTTTSATLGANITSNGGSAVTARGTCWGTTNPPATNCAPQGGTSIGVFTQARTGLPSGTLVYYRGYATNVSGTGYSPVGSFTTLTPLPVVTTSPATAITSTTATLNGGAVPSGAASTGWFRYSTVNPGVCNDAFGTRVPAAGGTALGSGMANVPFSQALSGLTQGTTYYVCALASNAGGTAVGAVQSFSSSLLPTITGNIAPATNPVNYNTGTTLTGTVSNATSCTVNGSPATLVGTTVTFNTGVLTSDRVYTLTCQNSTGDVTSGGAVTVNVRPGVTVTLTANGVATTNGTVGETTGNYRLQSSGIYNGVSTSVTCEMRRTGTNSFPYGATSNPFDTGTVAPPPAGTYTWYFRCTSPTGTLSNESSPVTLNVNAPAAAFASVPPAANATFASNVGVTQTQSAFVVTNTGDPGSTLTISSITSSNPVFVCSGVCTGSLAAGGSQTFSLSFTPTVVGPDAANITFVTNVGNITRTVSGTGYNPISASFNFGRVPSGKTKIRTDITITNNGVVTIPGGTFDLQSPYTCDDGTGTFVPSCVYAAIAPGASVTFTVQFAPPLPAVYNGRTGTFSGYPSSPVLFNGSGVLANFQYQEN